MYNGPIGVKLSFTSTCTGEFNTMSDLMIKSEDMVSKEVQHQRRVTRVLAGSLMVMALMVTPLNAQDGWQLSQNEAGEVKVAWGGQPLTEYRFVDLKKPVLYPVMGPGGRSMTRHYPLRAGVPGEATDHPHHKSIWLAHGDVNGYSYWDEKAVIDVVERPRIIGEAAFSVTQALRSTEPEPQEVGREHLTLRFGVVDSNRAPLDGGWWLQYDVEYEATQGPLTFGDTKEGFFAIRTHPSLRLSNDPRSGVTGANGRALNSSGLKDRELWGKRASWVAYSGRIDSQSVTMIMMDHPTNLRHPTTWHARDYGLVAANPFGLHDFEKQPKGTGDFTLEPGQRLKASYRIAFVPGELDEAAIRAAYEAFASAGAAP